MVKMDNLSFLFNPSMNNLDLYPFRFNASFITWFCPIICTNLFTETRITFDCYTYGNVNILFHPLIHPLLNSQIIITLYINTIKYFHIALLGLLRTFKYFKKMFECFNL